MLTHDKRPYFDPRTGAEITAEEFVQRYTVNAFIFVERDAVASVSDGTSGLPNLTKYGPVCRGCSTAVSTEGDLCPACVGKPQFQAPTTLWAITPGPAYVDTSKG